MSLGDIYMIGSLVLQAGILAAVLNLSGAVGGLRATVKYHAERLEKVERKIEEAIS